MGDQKCVGSCSCCKQACVGLVLQVWLVVLGLSLIVALQHRGFKAAILIGVAATAIGYVHLLCLHVLH